MLASLELTKALKTKLKSKGVTASAYKPEKPSLPFVILGEDTQSSDNVKNADAVVIRTRLTVYHDYKHMETVKRTLETIRVNCQDLTLDTYEVANVRIIDMTSNKNREIDTALGAIEIEYKLIRG